MSDVDNHSRSLWDEVTLVHIIFSGRVGDTCGDDRSMGLTNDGIK